MVSNVHCDKGKVTAKKKKKPVVSFFCSFVSSDSDLFMKLMEEDDQEPMSETKKKSMLVLDDDESEDEDSQWQPDLVQNATMNVSVGKYFVATENEPMKNLFLFFFSLFYHSK
jgi:hypothetical protein